MDTAQAPGVSVDLDDDAIEPTDPASTSSRGLRLPAGVVIAFLVALLALPLVVALVALRHPHWYPLLDMAQTEIRVRDVTSAHPPLIGLAGRIGVSARTAGAIPGR